MRDYSVRVMLRATHSIRLNISIMYLTCCITNFQSQPKLFEKFQQHLEVEEVAQRQRDVIPGKPSSIAIQCTVMISAGIFPVACSNLICCKFTLFPSDLPKYMHDAT
jgi:hypothetical protein